MFLTSSAIAVIAALCMTIFFATKVDVNNPQGDALDSASIFLVITLLCSITLAITALVQ